MNAKYKILIVEDNQDLNEMFKIAFEKEEFQIKTCLNGLEGITEVVDFNPDLLLLDIMMPQMDGYEVLKAITTNTSVRPIIVINSNLEQETDEKKALDLGADYFLRKSEYTPFELAEKIKLILLGKKK